MSLRIQVEIQLASFLRTVREKDTSFILLFIVVGTSMQNNNGVQHHSAHNGQEGHTAQEQFALFHPHARPHDCVLHTLKGSTIGFLIAVIPASIRYRKLLGIRMYTPHRLHYFVPDTLINILPIFWI